LGRRAPFLLRPKSSFVGRICNPLPRSLLNNKHNISYVASVVLRKRVQVGLMCFLTYSRRRKHNFIDIFLKASTWKAEIDGRRYRWSWIYGIIAV
jgi:hypothetical protein